MKYITCFIALIVLASCSVHQRSNFKADEEFAVIMNKPASRGGLLEIAVQGIFTGAKYFADKSSKSLTNTYSQSISINDYYNTDLGHVEKTYSQIHIIKYAKPTIETEKNEIKGIINNEFASVEKSRGVINGLTRNEIERTDKHDLLNFDAKIDLISDPENVGVTRLSFSDLRILFSKTKVFSDENLNAKVTVGIEGQWRTKDGSPMKTTLIEQEFDFKGLKYGLENQIQEPILSPWYYDIPITNEIDNSSKFGVLKITVQVVEYEGKKSNYINKLPGILNDNKASIIKDGASSIEKIIK